MKKKTTKAWAALFEGGKLFHSDEVDVIIYRTKKEAKEIGGQIVPCTITYSVQSKGDGI